MENKDIIDTGQSFYRRIITVATPIIIQNVISTSLNLADTIMIGRLGEAELAGSGAANQIFSIFSILCFGMYSGASVFVAQFWGARDLKSIRKILGFDIYLGLSAAVIFLGVIQAFAPNLIALFADDGDVIMYGEDYIRIVSYSYIVTAMTFAINFNSRTIQVLKVPTVISASAVLVNVIFNWLLIYGVGPFPEMGVEGAALATVIARCCELGFQILYISCWKAHPFHTSIRNLFSWDPELYRNILRRAVPVIVSEGGWSLGVAIVFATYGRIGASALAVVQVSNVVCQICQTAFFGFGNGSSILIGETLGKGDKVTAYAYTKKILRLGVIFTAIMVVMIIALRHPVAVIYDFSEETTELMMSTIFVFAFTMIPRMFSYLIQCGILRAGGDTFFCMVIELTSNLGIEVAMAYTGVVILGWPLPWCVALASLGNIFKTVTEYARYRSNKWMNIVIDIDEDEVKELC